MPTAMSPLQHRNCALKEKIIVLARIVTNTVGTGLGVVLYRAGVWLLPRLPVLDCWDWRSGNPRSSRLLRTTWLIIQPARQSTARRRKLHSSRCFPSLEY